MLSKYFSQFKLNATDGLLLKVIVAVGGGVDFECNEKNIGNVMCSLPNKV